MDDHALSLPRRRLLRLVAAAPLALAAGLPPGRAEAARAWCRSDPVVKIGGRVANVYVSAHVRDMAQARALATGATEVVLTLPPGVRAQHLASDNGFGHGYVVKFAESTELSATAGIIPVRVEVVVPMRKQVPIRVEFVPGRPGRLEAGRGEGTANAKIRFTAPERP